MDKIDADIRNTNKIETDRILSVIGCFYQDCLYSDYDDVRDYWLSHPDWEMIADLTTSDSDLTCSELLDVLADC